MVGFIDDFADFLPDTLIVTSGIVNGFGKFIASGSVESYPCRIEGSNRMVRDSAGREVVSTVQIIVGASPDLTTNLHRYTLPSRFIPSGDRVAIAIERESDEDGPCYEVVLLP